MSAGGMVNVTITGSGFQNGASLSFENFPGATPSATNVVVVNSTTITADVSVGTNGPNKNRTGDVRVTNPDASTDSCLNCFTVTVGSASSASSNVVTRSTTTVSNDSPAGTADTSQPAPRSEPAPTGDGAIAQPSSQTGSTQTSDSDLVDLAFSDPATLEDPLLGQFAVALAG